MAAPKRTAALGTEGAVVDDLILIRDAGGIDVAPTERMSGTLALAFGVHNWAPGQVRAIRGLLVRHTRRVTATAEDENDEPCAVAAIRSVRGILLQPADAVRPASVIRRECREAANCFLANDSIRKRELPTLLAIAHSIRTELDGRSNEKLPSVAAMYHMEQRFVQVAVLAVEEAIDIHNRRLEGEESDAWEEATEAVVWCLGQVCIIPTYAGKARPNDVDVRTLAAVDQLILTLTSLPFANPATDVPLLVQSVRERVRTPHLLVERLGEQDRSISILRHVLNWLDSCSASCTYFRSQQTAGYCRPHYWLAVGEAFCDAVDDMLDGELDSKVEYFLTSAWITALADQYRLDPPTFPLRAGTAVTRWRRRRVNFKVSDDSSEQARTT